MAEKLNRLTADGPFSDTQMVEFAMRFMQSDSDSDTLAQ
jgi:spore coat polysaccharide biosynthesis protein SpsF (cytidylyltransferase family)